MQHGNRADEASLQAMCEFAPHPNLGTDLKDLSLYLDPIRAEIEKRQSIRFL